MIGDYRGRTVQACNVTLKSQICSHKNLWLVYLLSHHKRAAPQTHLFRRSWFGCLDHTKVQWKAFTPAQTSYTNPANGPEFSFN